MGSSNNNEVICKPKEKQAKSWRLESILLVICLVVFVFVVVSNFIPTDISAQNVKAVSKKIAKDSNNIDKLSIRLSEMDNNYPAEKFRALLITLRIYYPNESTEDIATFATIQFNRVNKKLLYLDLHTFLSGFKDYSLGKNQDFKTAFEEYSEMKMSGSKK